MNNHLRAWFVPMLAAAVLCMAGCYTQVGSVRPDADRDYRQEESQPSSDIDTTSGDYASGQNDEYYNDQEGYSRYRFHFDYYYPPSYYPFNYRWNYNSYYDPYWYPYDPYYPTIYMGWGYLPFPNYYSYYSPYYQNYRYRSYASSGAGRGHGTTRMIGNVRATGSVRGGESGYGGRVPEINLPTGARSVSSGTRVPATVAPKISTGSRGSSVSRSGAVTRGGSTRSGSTGGTRVEPRRENKPAPAHPVPPRESGGQRHGGGERSGGGATTSSSPPPSSPPPSSQGSAPSNNGSRGNGSRR